MRPEPMKVLLLPLIVLVSSFSGGCALMPVKATVQVIEHKKEPQGHYSILIKIIKPAKLAGRYDSVSTWRGDLVKDADGGLYETYANFKTVARLGPTSYNHRPSDYSLSAPQSRDGDFLEFAKRVK